ncbi:MAG: KH domain-containing protein [archaeon]
MDGPEEFAYELKIPKDRVAVLIGVEGSTKKELEEATLSKMSVDSKEGDITLVGKDPLQLYQLREVIKAIARGFNPETAKLLLKQDYLLEIVSLAEYSKQKNHLLRLKGRVIGADGKSRRTIEELTGCFICVYGKTIALIGQVDQMSIAKRAVLSLLEGSTHASVYKWLERQRRELSRRSAEEF